jgi:hypothetical protein
MAESWLDELFDGVDLCEAMGLPKEKFRFPDLNQERLGLIDHFQKLRSRREGVASADWLEKYMVVHFLFRFYAERTKVYTNVESVVSAMSIGVWNAGMSRHRLKRHEAFRYISANGMPMMGDIFVLEPEMRAAFHLIEDNIEFFASPVDFFESAAHFIENPDLVERYFNLLRAARRHSAYSERQFLGSESERKPEKETRPIHPTLVEEAEPDKIIEFMMRNPAETSEKVAMLFGRSVGQIRAFKAHITMGTYGQLG